MKSDRGNLTHGYVSTSHASQGKSVQDVFVSQSTESFPASSAEQFYVSVSRGKQKVKVFTDDKEELLENISQSSQRLSAVDLIKGVDPRRRIGSSISKVLKNVWNTVTMVGSSIKGSAKRKFNLSRLPVQRKKEIGLVANNEARLEMA